MVLRARPTHPGAPPAPDARADALVTDDPARVLAVRTADCTPVLIAAADGRTVGAIHAGWRGVIAGVVPATVAALRTLGAGRLIAAIGPCIGVGAFEVGPEVVAEFERLFGRGTPHVHRNGKNRIDLKGAIQEQLTASGLAQTDIDTLPHCTVRDAGLFFSHRRERGLTGRMASVIAPSGFGSSAGPVLR
jgi:YfiH family protein